MPAPVDLPGNGEYETGGAHRLCPAGSRHDAPRGRHVNPFHLHVAVHVAAALQEGGGQGSCSRLIAWLSHGLCCPLSRVARLACLIQQLRPATRQAVSGPCHDGITHSYAPSAATAPAEYIRSRIFVPNSETRNGRNQSNHRTSQKITLQKVISQMPKRFTKIDM